MDSQDSEGVASSPSENAQDSEDGIASDRQEDAPSDPSSPNP